ncbi:YqcC family protein [Pseudoalteromonas tunicata]|uniref:YqcC-like domain-containing protein n=1 Tax=Pseudoalteromonas tunicata D2 TaxID=87626 RepID=A4C5J1_9GAMM|nr:YqcC family protein [Pseudoalteromonas tunicata]ATC95220.1 hypothetical protein PTUN_a2795 [Pseudoalteromonas tunicata]EAR29245.1 hypothetical protein PTD2_10534 [Pseudoalteromonas tunicata D2]MDP4982338.1 YqcC family protein [Pseudoalteromonas tunicata]MDP5213185.1 YqcC family protein [Pseudoalteromonas tunicata]
MIEQTVMHLLDNLEHNLKKHQLWQQELPSLDALNSSAPFCCDTLAFEQWLQFIFIPKMRQLIALNIPLPASMTLLPMAEQSWQAKLSQYQDLLEIISGFDQLFVVQ